VTRKLHRPEALVFGRIFIGFGFPIRSGLSSLWYGRFFSLPRIPLFFDTREGFLFLQTFLVPRCSLLTRTLGLFFQAEPKQVCLFFFCRTLLSMTKSVSSSFSLKSWFRSQVQITFLHSAQTLKKTLLLVKHSPGEGRIHPSHLFPIGHNLPWPTPSLCYPPE